MSRVESFAVVLNDYLVRAGVSEREFVLRTSVHPTTVAEYRSGADPCNRQRTLR